MFEPNVKNPKKDEKNPDKKMRSRSRLGIAHIIGMTFENDEYINGKLYSVQDGNTYSLKAP